MPDFRGEEYWLPDGSFHRITELNITKPTNAKDTPPAPPTAQELFDAEIDNSPALKALYDEMESNSPGFRGRAKGRV